MVAANINLINCGPALLKRDVKSLILEVTFPLRRYSFLYFQIYALMDFTLTT